MQYDVVFDLKTPTHITTATNLIKVNSITLQTSCTRLQSISSGDKAGCYVIKCRIDCFHFHSRLFRGEHRSIMTLTALPDTSSTIRQLNRFNSPQQTAT